MKRHLDTPLVLILSGSFILASALACADPEEEPTEQNNGTTDPGSPPAAYGNRCEVANPRATCGADQLCEEWSGDGLTYCTCPEGLVRSGRNCNEPGGTSQLQTCSLQEEGFCDGQGFCYDLDQEACDYHTERGITPPAECASITPSGQGSVQAICVSSVADPSANLYDPDGFCDFTQFWSNPTSLPVDCRCAQPFEVHECKRPFNRDAEVTFGAGPRWRAGLPSVQMYGAALDGREMLITSTWSSSNRQNQGVVFAMDLDTGDRRIVSGSWNSPADGTFSTGDGPDFVNAYNIEIGADGDYYVVGGTGEASNPIVWRVDAESGDRELVYEAKGDGFATCANGLREDEPGTKEVNLNPLSWTMDDAGNHYFGVLAGAPGPSVVKISPDGQSCEYLTRVLVDPDGVFEGNVGEGFDDIQFYFSALEIVGDTMYALSDRQIYTIDMTNGRRRLFTDAQADAVGSGSPNLGKVWLTWDPHHEVLWSYGSPSDENVVIAVDPEDGERIASPCWHPTLGRLAACAGNSIGVGGVMKRGGLVVDPEGAHDLFFAFDGISVIRLDQATLNVNVISL
jgi:hypothetical protein